MSIYEKLIRLQKLGNEGSDLGSLLRQISVEEVQYIDNFIFLAERDDNCKLLALWIVDIRDINPVLTRIDIRGLIDDSVKLLVSRNSYQEEIVALSLVDAYVNDSKRLEIVVDNYELDQYDLIGYLSNVAQYSEKLLLSNPYSHRNFITLNGVELRENYMDEEDK